MRLPKLPYPGGEGVTISSAMARVCPDHNLPLDPKTFRNVTVDVCPKCAGVFFDEGEVNRLRLDGNDAMVEVEDAIVPAEGHSVDFREMTERPRACPNCRFSMDKMRYLYNSPVMLDSCSNCGGVWVEDGELRSMRDVLEGCGEPQATKVRTEAYVAMAQLKSRTDANLMRVKRVERAMRLFGKRSY